MSAKAGTDLGSAQDAMAGRDTDPGQATEICPAQAAASNRPQELPSRGAFIDELCENRAGSATRSFNTNNLGLPSARRIRCPGKIPVGYPLAGDTQAGQQKRQPATLLKVAGCLC